VSRPWRKLSPSINAPYTNTIADFAPTAFQNLLYQAAGDEGLLLFAGKQRSIESIVLLCNGISFAIQVVVFLVIGSFADFGTWRPNILIGLSIVAYAIGFGWLGVHDAEKWHAGVGLYMVGLIAYQTTLTFWTAAFPGLARNTPEMKAKAIEYNAGTISREEYDYADTMKRSQLANVAFYVQSVAEIFILAVIVGIMFGLRVDDSETNNNRGLSVLIAFASGVWLLVSLPWFFLEKRRPGIDTMGQNIIVAGIKQLYIAMRQIWKLKQSLLYLVGEDVDCHPCIWANLLTTIGYFLLGDSLNTTVTVIATLQNSIVAYNTLQLTYLLIVGIAAQVRTHTSAPPFSIHIKPLTTPGNRHLHLYDPANPFPSLPQNNVQRHSPLHSPPRHLGHDRNLDAILRLPPHVGNLGVPSFLRALRVPLVQLLTDHDLRGHAPRPRVLVLQPL
jgi:hypothetical protein